MEFKRLKCSVCGKYLISLGGHYLHSDSPCSGTTDAIAVTMEVEDEQLQKIWQELYGKPEYSDHELLNLIWNSKILKFLIRLYFKLKKR